MLCEIRLEVFDRETVLCTFVYEAWSLQSL